MSSYLKSFLWLICFSLNLSMARKPLLSLSIEPLLKTSGECFSLVSVLNRRELMICSDPIERAELSEQLSF